MLNADEINAFEKLVREAVSLLPENTSLPVVGQRLFLEKDGSWSTAEVGRICLLGDLPIRELLKVFVFAASGIEPTDDQIDDDELLILERLEENLLRAMDEINRDEIIIRTLS